MISNLQPEQKQVKYLDDLILNLINTNDYNVTLTAKNINSSFSISMSVQYSSLISNFDDCISYLSYLNFTGQVDTVKVTDLLIKGSCNETIREFHDSEYDGPKIKLVDWYVKTLTENDLQYLKNAIEFNFQIVPELKTLEIDLEDEHGECIIQNLKQGINREILPDNKLKVTLVDLRNNSPIKVKFVYTYEGTTIVESNIELFVENIESAKVRLQEDLLFKHFRDSKYLKIRNSNTGEYVGKFSGVSISKTENTLENEIAFYNKIVEIEDYFETKFILPNPICSDDYNNVQILFNTIKDGFFILNGGEYIFSNSSISEKITEDSQSHNHILIYCYPEIELFDKGDLNSDDSIVWILPDCDYIDIESGHLKIECKKPCALVNKKRIKNFSEDEIFKIGNNLRHNQTSLLLQ
jgi:hypothetical protein